VISFSLNLSRLLAICILYPYRALLKDIYFIFFCLLANALPQENGLIQPGQMTATVKPPRIFKY